MSDKNPFDYFDKIFCINLDSRPDRWEQVQKEFDKFGIREKVNRISAVTADEARKLSRFKLKGDQAGQYGCCLSHYKCLEDAIKSGVKSYLVFEDDVVFDLSGGDEIFDVTEFVENWELFLFGYVKWGTEHVDDISVEICKLDSFGCTHAIGVNISCFDKLNREFQKRVVEENSPRRNWYKRIDYFYSTICDDIYALKNPICFQREGYSDIANENIDRATKK